MSRSRFQRRCLAACAAWALAAAPALSAALTVVQGDLQVAFNDHGISESIVFAGHAIGKQHPGGISVSGSPGDQWQPWVAQSAASDVRVERTDAADHVTVTAVGSLRQRSWPAACPFQVETRVYRDRLVQTARIQAPSAELWRRFGSALLIDADAMSPANYRAETNAWKLLPEDAGNRNLIWPATFRTLDVATPDVGVTVTLEGMGGNFFDDRKPGRTVLTVEFGQPAVAGASGHAEAAYTLTMTFQARNGAPLPVAAPVKTAAPARAGCLDLTATNRCVLRTPSRLRYTLSGEWDLLPLGNGSEFASALFRYPVPAGMWQKIQVPKAPWDGSAWPGPQHAAWYRTEFTLPPECRGRELWLVCNEISYDSAFYLNGTLVGRHFGGYAPVRIALGATAAVGGRNVLEVFTGDATAALDPAAYPDGAPDPQFWSRLKPNSVRGPIFCAGRGILQDVFIEALPSASVHNVFVRPSVRQHTLSADVAIANDGLATRTFTVRAVVLDATNRVLALPDAEVVVPPGAVRAVSTAAPWRTARLWSVGEPNLYVLRTELREGERTVDDISTRFGFREFWIDGTNFVLNGTPIRLRECATHIYYHPGGRAGGTWDVRYKGQPEAGARAELEAIQWANFNCTRMVHRPHPEFFYDIADELGHLVIAHMPFGFLKDQYAFDDPCLAATTRATVGDLVRLSRNHPSIILWEGENEGFPYGMNDLALRFANFYDSCVGQVCRDLDPTRAIKYGGDGDLFGRAPIVDLHGGDLRTRPDLALPNSGWQVLDQPAGRPYGLEGGSAWRWDRRKPVYFGEGLYWFQAVDDPGEVARFMGERTFEDTHVGTQYYRGQEICFEGQVAFWQLALPTWRMLDGPAGFCPWAVVPAMGVDLSQRDQPVICATRELMKPERFFHKQVACHVYAGDTFAWDFCFLNDTLKDGRYRLAWHVNRGERVLASDTWEAAIAPAGKHWHSVSFQAPAVDHAEDLTLTVTQSRAGEVLHEESAALRVYPHQPLYRPQHGAPRLFDPSGNLARIFAAQGVACRPMATLAQALAEPGGMLLVGENALVDAAVPVEAFQRWLRTGGRALVLSQARDTGYAPATRVAAGPRVTREQVFAADAGHPLVQGIAPDELTFWRGTNWDTSHSVAVNAPEKFCQGNQHAVLECDSLWFAPLQELRLGDGLLVECGLDIVRKFTSEPVAAQIWNNLLTRLDIWQPASRVPLRVLDDAALAATLAKQGITCANAAAVPASSGILLLSCAPAPALRQAVRTFAEQGGTVWVHARQGIDTVWLASLTGAKITVAPLPTDVHIRSVRRTPAGSTSTVLAGISSVALSSHEVVDDLWRVEGQGVVELASAGAVFTVPAGRGTILVERLSWDTSGDLTHRRWAEHALHGLVTNLGGEIDCFRAGSLVRIDPADCFGLDLRAACNRGFRDEVAGDGQGGWTDQGPQNDAGGMPTGRQMFALVPFDVINPEANAGRACVVLRGSAEHQPACPARTAEIAVAAPVRALCFLHTAAWYDAAQHADKLVARYVVTYADGTQAAVPVLGGRHIQDWWSIRPLAEAHMAIVELRSGLAQDTTAVRRGLAVQVWQNPSPEKGVRSVRLESGESGAVPILLGITGVRNKTDAAINNPKEQAP